MNNEEPLNGGAINTVTRSGNVVYRSGGPWVPTIHQVLDHLNRNDFHWAPRALGVDDTGREMISWLPGESMLRPWRPIMFSNDALIQAATMVRALHDATRSLELPPETVWRPGAAPKMAAQVVRHGDLGPWNTLWEGDRLTGLIDWDFAEPGEAITDLAQLALYFVPLRGEDHWRECGFPSRPDFAERLAAICDAYGGVSPTEVAREIERLQLTEMGRIEDFANQGLYPWTMFRENGEIERTRHEVEWLRTIITGIAVDPLDHPREDVSMADTPTPPDSISIGTPVVDYNGQPLGEVHEIHPHYVLVGQSGQHKDLEIPTNAITGLTNGVLQVSVTRASASEVDEQETAHNLIEKGHPSHE